MNAFTPSLPAPLTTAGIAVALSGRVAALSAGRSEAWTAAINHRFVNELFSGELDDAQLSYYIIQDNQFFVPFLELLGEALVRADTVEAKLVFGRQLGMICSEESGWFEATFDELGVSQADRAHPHLSEPTRSFENHPSIRDHSGPIRHGQQRLAGAHLTRPSPGVRTDLGQPFVQRKDRHVRAHDRRGPPPTSDLRRQGVNDGAVPAIVDHRHEIGPDVDEPDEFTASEDAVDRAS